MAFEQMNNAPRSETIWFSVHEPDETTIDTRLRLILDIFQCDNNTAEWFKFGRLLCSS